jgi:2Fe-2S ferredoxin
MFRKISDQMSQIVIQNLFNRIISSETDNRKVIEIIHENRIDWMHACGKKGRCTTCKIILITGEENLSPPTDRELVFLESGRLKPDQRLACQATLLKGKIKVKVAEINKFPTQEYSE